MDVFPGLPVADLVATDPPYGIGLANGVGDGGTDASGRYKRAPKQYCGNWDDERPGAEVFARVLKAATVAVIWGGNYFADILPRGGRWLFWDKLNSMPSYSDGEMAWSSIPGSAVKKFTQCNNGLASLKDGERKHPTQKPVSLMVWTIEQAAKCDSVIDPFMGSGSTGVACAKMGRRFVGIEKERKYFDAACERIDDAYRQSRMFD